MLCCALFQKLLTRSSLSYQAGALRECHDEHHRPVLDNEHALGNVNPLAC